VTLALVVASVIGLAIAALVYVR